MPDDLRERAEKLAAEIYEWDSSDIPEASIAAIESALRDVQREAIEAAAKLVEERHVHRIGGDGPLSAESHAAIATAKAIRALLPPTTPKGGEQ
ncbi:MAG TPA: hypothetical protein VEA41_04675 [Salinarimonas sp.]|nr:hypothetical protein [Salinarimonas sp.]